MTNELKPKIWEFRVAVEDSPDLVLDYHSNDSSINFAPIVGAIEQIVGVELVTVSPEGSKIRVVARNTIKIHTQVKKLFERMYGVTPFSYWRNSEVVDAQL